MSFNNVYVNLLNQLLNPETSVEEFNERTQTKIRIIPGTVSFTLDLSNNRLPIPTSRKFHIKTCAAEIAWFFQGTQDISWFQKYSHIWNDFVEEDGRVDSAYGYRWKVHFGRDQIDDAVRALQVNKSDRRIFISNWDPARDGLGRPAKNVPCPLGFTLSIVANKLHMSLLMRSSDVFVGLPYDVAGHAMILKILADTLEVEVGTLGVTLAHAHLYENHYVQARETINNVYNPKKHPKLLNSDQMTVQFDPDRFVADYVTELSKIDQTDYNPRPDIVV